MLEALSKKQKIIFFIILSVMIIFIIYYLYCTLYQNDFTFSSNENEFINDNLIENNSVTNLSDLTKEEHHTIIVYVCGAVKESKVITLKENSRISDAIDAVGGLTKEADLTNINLAYILEDGEKIYIPQKGEENPETSSNLSTELIETSIPTSSKSKQSSSTKSTSKININKATQTELEMIPGVGPSTALKIIEFREQNGKFHSIDDIKNVTGIGDAKYEKMKKYITVK